MIKILSAVLTFLCVAAAAPVAANDLPNDDPSNDANDTAATIAVYVSGRRDRAEKNAWRTFMLDALVKSGKYQAVERSKRLLEQIDNEQQTQRSGAVDDAQISLLGKQSGVRFICVTDVTYINGMFQISARILDVETAKVAAIAVADSRALHVDDMKRISYDLAARMLGDAGLAAPAPKEGESELLVIGPGANFGSGTITVLIDGEPRGSIRGDGTLRVMIPNGTRHMQVKWKGDGTASELKKPVKFSAKKGEKTVFRVKMELLSSKISVVKAKG